MKTKIFTLFIIILLVCALPVFAAPDVIPVEKSTEIADTFVVNHKAELVNVSESDYNFKTSDGEATITGVSSLVSGSIIIPDTLGGYPVTCIDSWAFSYCPSISQITIPSSITKINNFAFSDYHIEQILVDSDNANYSNDSMGVLFNKDKTILIRYPAGNRAESYSIPYGVKEIASNAFTDCAYLSIINIPSTVNKIGDEAFSSCLSLTDMKIPENVTAIGAGVFRYCSSLNSIIIPKSVTCIGNLPLYMCSALNSIIVDKDNAYYSSDDCGALFNKDKTLLIQYPIGSALSSYTIPESVTDISEYAFTDGVSLTSIYISNKVENIGAYAFSNTGYYKNGSNWENDVLYLGNHIIAAKKDISGIYTVKEGTKTISSNAFIGCTSLIRIVLPESITNIGKTAFSNCENLVRITIPGVKTNIGENAFFGCDILTIYGIPNTKTHVYANENDIAFVPMIVFGDINSNGTPDESDINAVADYLSSVSSRNFSGSQIFAANLCTKDDINGEPVINIKDLIALAQLISNQKA